LSAVARSRVEVFVLPVVSGGRFCLLRRPTNATAARGSILFVHPFAEEMNKSRRAIGVAARGLAQLGWTILQIDLDGCGDSTGDFSQATWSGWQDDVCRAADWLRQNAPPVEILWGLRLGALLAASVIERIEPAPDLLLWQPVLSGKAHLTQFLRLKAAEEMLGQAGGQGATARLRAQLVAGEHVQVAGYLLGPGLALGIDKADFKLPEGYRGRVAWLESVAAAPTVLAAASEQRVQALTTAGQSIVTQVVCGPSFWQSTEIEEASALTDATLTLLSHPASNRETARA